MLGYAAVTLLATVIKLAVIAGLVFMAVTARNVRKENRVWTPEVAKRRQIAWFALVLGFFFLFN